MVSLERSSSSSSRRRWNLLHISINLPWSRVLYEDGLPPPPPPPPPPPGTRDPVWLRSSLLYSHHKKSKNQWWKGSSFWKKRLMKETLQSAWSRSCVEEGLHCPPFFALCSCISSPRRDQQTSPWRWFALPIVCEDDHPVQSKQHGKQDDGRHTQRWLDWGAVTYLHITNPQG